ncbi:MAG: hypothetical protein GXO39_04405 [Thermotogae bacterium]|nr:hypothetical protein [Thermotogota bacterium]
MRYKVYFKDLLVEISPEDVKPNIRVRDGKTYTHVATGAPMAVCEQLKEGDVDNQGFARIIRVGDQTVVLEFNRFEIVDNVLYLPDCYWPKTP